MSTKKKFRVPHSFVIVFSIIIAAVLLTWIIPAGEYVRVENADGIKVIDPTQFSYIQRTPVNPLLIPMYIVKAFVKRVDIMLVILFSGGAFHMLTQSGALQAVIAKLAKKFSNNLYVFIPILTLMFGLICTTQAVNMFIAFAPVMVMLALAIGLDSITGAAIILLGGAIGFSTGTLNPNTTVVAQKIAELPLYSGIGYRWVCFAVYYVITNIFLVRYALKIKKDPTKSPMYDLDQTSELRAGGGLDDFGTIDTRKILSIIALVVSLGVVIYGSIKLGWDMPEMAAMFIWLAIIVGFISGFDTETISKNFLEGCKKMMSAMIIIGLAQSISTIMSDGKIIDTVVHALAGGLGSVPTLLQAPAMLIANAIINVFLTSGSGQAAAVMPILVPLSDLIGVTRQTAVLAFNFGDGFCNYILPTSTALMGIISACNIPYDRWMRFMWKMFAIWLVVGTVMLVIAQLINYGPM
ncbi:Na+/H+ antiporter NhaC family protein [Clostridium sp. AF32-12BH]|uniref:YfcC family protein n=1 Tax=Clostridium sp. AF32-12BH TaxID=2292006 RepID=UPI000E48E016|nr:Na+/H+ antiporter NhaC family protein [Clostridium sp. AF32-12BH]RHP46040.1 YfcC family protein [Clostridium sp. AF32-12BH]